MVPLSEVYSRFNCARATTVVACGIWLEQLQSALRISGDGSSLNRSFYGAFDIDFHGFYDDGGRFDR